MQAQAAVLPASAPATIILTAPLAADAAEAGVTAEALEGAVSSFGEILAAQVDAIAMEGEALLDRTLVPTEIRDDTAAELLEQLAADISAPTQFFSPIAPIVSAEAQRSGMKAGETDVGIAETTAEGAHQGRRGTGDLKQTDDIGSDALPAALNTAFPSAGKLPAHDGLERELTTVDGATPANGGQATAETQKSSSVNRAVEAQNFNPRHIPEPVRSGAWSEALGQRVAWMSKENVQVVHLQVEPPNLGPLEVQRRMTNDHANVVFVSPHAFVREAISDSLSKLNDLLAAGGVSLGSVSVNTQSHTGQDNSGSQSSPSEAGEPEPLADGSVLIAGMARQARARVGLVDIFA